MHHDMHQRADGAFTKARSCEWSRLSVILHRRQPDTLIKQIDLLRPGFALFKERR